MDPIQTLLSSPAGRNIASRLGFPPPPELRRYSPGQPLLVGPALVGAAPGGRLSSSAVAALKGAGAEVVEAPTSAGDSGPRWGALVFDASGITEPGGLAALRDFFAPAVRRLASAGRVLVLGTSPASTTGPDARIAQRALEGFTRSLAKELRGGSTAQLVLVEPGAESRIESTLRFLVSARSAFVDGQVVEISNTVPDGVAGGFDLPNWELPLAGKVVVVTGAARGIGASMVSTLARDGATVLGVDIAALASDLQKVTTAAGGAHLVADVTAPDAGARIARQVRERWDGVLHGIVHNAGITRDRKLVNLSDETWRQVIEINVAGPLRITTELLHDGVLAAGSRVVGISSIAGIAGNGGQTNYAASKAGVIGMIDALAPELAPRGITVNAIAPGFIETAMTQRIPLMIREGGRRLSSLQQGGRPVDIAEAVGWLLSPASSGVTGNVVRVCGQGLIGA